MFDETTSLDQTEQAQEYGNGIKNSNEKMLS